jgi:zinc finger protein AEBP2
VLILPLVFTARRFDFFDVGMMDILQYRLEKAESVMRGKDVEVTFKGRIIGKRRSVGGEDEFQVTWNPAKM